MASASAPTCSFLPLLPLWWTLIKTYKLKETLPSPSCFWLGVLSPQKKEEEKQKRHCISFPIHLWKHEKYIQGFVVHTDLDKNLSPGIYHLLDHAQVIEPLSSIASDGVQSSQKETIWPQ